MVNGLKGATLAAFVMGAAVVAPALCGSGAAAQVAAHGAAQGSTHGSTHGSGQGAAMDGMQEGRITVTGEGVVDSVPDMATVRLGVTTEADAARDAITDNNMAMAQVVARLEAAGIAPRDLQTAEFSVNPRWSRPPEGVEARPDGYMVRNLLVVRVRDLAMLGDILDQVADDGANAFEGLSFGLSDPAAAQDAARKAAVADAQARAALYAEAAGVATGRLLELGESTQYGGPVMLERAEMRMAAADQSVPIAGGEVSVTVQVTLVYAIEQ